MRAPRLGALIVGCCLAAVGLLGLLDALGAIGVGPGALLAVLLIGLGLAGFARAVRGGTRPT